MAFSLDPFLLLLHTDLADAVDDLFHAFIYKQQSLIRCLCIVSH